MRYCATSRRRAAEPREGRGSISRVAGPNIEALSSSRFGIRAGDRDQIAISRIEREGAEMFSPKIYGCGVARRCHEAWWNRRELAATVPAHAAAIVL
jgi:hypothetical protein